MLMDVGVGTSEHKVIHSFIHSFIGNYGLLRRANPLSKSALLVNVSFFPADISKGSMKHDGERSWVRIYFGLQVLTLLALGFDGWLMMGAPKSSPIMLSRVVHKGLSSVRCIHLTKHDKFDIIMHFSRTYFTMVGTEGKVSHTKIKKLKKLKNWLID